MPAKNPRVNVVLEKPLYNALHDLAEDEGVSMSMLMRDLVREVLEIREDRALADLAAERENGFDRRKAVGHEDVWG
ncbi:ribbon-helix-helix domain-containing protein [Syntrophotalea acetylenica]|uniref:Antitoxin, RHH family protein n=1 Tax=Syntrophotalea acetylenica TaxID=29542 RepID=A0A1L3GII9_SYNAC|nr:ribbon-helix-helix protein, CopG family [Syntrophotalea acetylenica]APG25710.1 antitoxin, RHH family protein [Syntrophotalea acetylenica]APG43783.1 antitoxin, RHH family protein [Syntrophotalea acetylenica]